MPRARPPETPRLRVALFTDTLGDVNGVSRFIRNAGEFALHTRRDLTILTSTRFELPALPNIVNILPRAAMRMPRYENLELVLPRVEKLVRTGRDLRPHVIHVSTPGSVGLAGLRAAKRMGVPLAGVYHTDFPAYVERLFHEPLFTRACRAYMRWFYRRFSAVFVRSEEYRGCVQELGVKEDRIHALRPGIRTDEFHPRFAGLGSWDALGVPPGAVRVLYVGRVSVEKNLPLLVNAWKLVESDPHSMCAHLLIVGDGPYRAEMEERLRGARVRFVGFRHGEELSRLYADAHAVAFPSATDTLGQVVMEAQASAVPVLVSDVGGPKTMVREGETGCVLPAHDARAWANTIAALVHDDALRARMGTAARAHMEQYSIERSIDHWWSVHESLAPSR